MQTPPSVSSRWMTLLSTSSILAVATTAILRGLSIMSKTIIACTGLAVVGLLTFMSPTMAEEQHEKKPDTPKLEEVVHKEKATVTAKDIQGEWTIDLAASWELVKDDVKLMIAKDAERKVQTRPIDNGNGTLTIGLPPGTPEERLKHKQDKFLKEKTRNVKLTADKIFMSHKAVFEGVETENYTITAIKDNVISIDGKANVTSDGKVIRVVAVQQSIIVNGDTLIWSQIEPKETFFKFVLKRKATVE
jgi:hypothetical protein